MQLNSIAAGIDTRQRIVAIKHRESERGRERER